VQESAILKMETKIEKDGPMKHETPVAEMFTVQFMIDLWKPVFDSRFKREKVAANQKVTAYIESLSAVAKELFVEDLLKLSIDWQLNSDQRSELLMPLAHLSLRATLLKLLRQHLPEWQSAPEWLERALSLTTIPGIWEILREVFPSFSKAADQPREASGRFEDPLEILLETACARFPDRVGLRKLLAKQYVLGLSATLTVTDWDLGGLLPKSSVLLISGLGESLHSCRDHLLKLRKLLAEPVLMNWQCQKQYLERCGTAEIELAVVNEYLQSDDSGSFLEWLKEIHGFAGITEYLQSRQA